MLSNVDLRNSQTSVLFRVCSCIVKNIERCLYNSETDKLLLGNLPNYFSGIPNYFSNKVYKKAKELLNIQLNQLMLVMFY